MSGLDNDLNFCDDDLVGNWLVAGSPFCRVQWLTDVLISLYCRIVHPAYSPIVSVSNTLARIDHFGFNKNLCLPMSMHLDVCI